VFFTSSTGSCKRFSCSMENGQRVLNPSHFPPPPSLLESLATPQFPSRMLPLKNCGRCFLTREYLLIPKSGPPAFPLEVRSRDDEHPILPKPVLHISFRPLGEPIFYTKGLDGKNPAQSTHVVFIASTIYSRGASHRTFPSSKSPPLFLPKFFAT